MVLLRGRPRGTDRLVDTPNAWSGAHDELTDDAVAGDFRIRQRRRGHRYALDDTLVAWVAARQRPQARTVLDLGCGCGAVLLMLAYRLPEARVYGLEAQEVSFALARDNVARNALAARVRLARGDLREPSVVAALLDDAPRVELVTGTPPYFPVGTATPSPDAQRRHARMELRGGVEAYLMAASRVVASGGLVVVCADARKPERVLQGAHAAALVPLECMAVTPIEGKVPLFSVWQLVPAADAAPDAPVRMCDVVARTADGARTEVSREVRRFFGLPAPIS
jgi:tRNA1(Val) A37 N6-methylase TrmN6